VVPIGFQARKKDYRKFEVKTDAAATALLIKSTYLDIMKPLTMAAGGA